MKTTTIKGIAILTLGAFAIMASANAQTGGHYGRSEVYDIGNVGHHKTETGNTATPDTSKQVAAKKLPGVDCKLYEGGTNQHTYLPYEIGNPNRPECPQCTNKEDK